MADEERTVVLEVDHLRAPGVMMFLVLHESEILASPARWCW